jgi:hypothetical protein
VRRFRPNVVVDGSGEDTWVGRSLRVGQAGLVVRKRTSRCVVVTRSQPEGIERDLGVARALRERDLKLGVYALVDRPGRLSIGDELCLDQ